MIIRIVVRYQTDFATYMIVDTGTKLYSSVLYQGLDKDKVSNTIEMIVLAKMFEPRSCSPIIPGEETGSHSFVC